MLEMVYGDPHPRVGAHVLTYCGYTEWTGAPSRRRELPWPGVVLIFDFGPTLRILDSFDGTVSGTHASGFVAGVHDIFTLTETSGAQSGLQVNFTPLGARQFLGVPLDELANRVVSVEDVFGAAGPRMTAALHDAPGWGRASTCSKRSSPGASMTRLRSRRAPPPAGAGSPRRTASSKSARSRRRSSAAAST